MKASSQFLFISILAVACSGCGNGGIDISVDPPPPLPGQPQVTVEGETKQLVFSWAAVTGADHYRLMENPDGHSGFAQVGDNIPAGTLTAKRDIAVHLFDWVNAQYIVEACNVTGCSSSDVATTTDVMLDTIAYVKASNTDIGAQRDRPEDWFGSSITLSADGNTLAVGTPYEDSSATGINGDQNDNSAMWAGATYLFRFDGNAWYQQAYIKASNTDPDDRFGRSVALSADGNTLAVGTAYEDSSATGINGNQADNSASGSGAAYLFRFDGNAWYQQAYIKASNTQGSDRFGGSVALSADGNTLAVGAHLESTRASGSGAAYLFRFDGNAWYQQAHIKGSNTGFDDYFGWAVALGADGNTLAVGAFGEYSSATGINGDQADNSAMWAGAAYLFRFDGNAWYQQAYIKASNTDDHDRFGWSLALSADGNTLAVEGPFEDSSATGINGDQADNSATDAGAAYLFRFDGSAWYQQAYIKASNSARGFGGAALSADGDTLVAGASDDSSATGINGDQNDLSAPKAGAAYLFRFDGTDWYQQAYLKASNTDAFDYFGAVALSADGNTLAVGAMGEDSSAVGVNGDQADNSAKQSGAVYVY